MTSELNPEDAWLEVARRVVVNRFSGATADDDDVLADVDLAEALLNPHRGSDGKQGLGGPGMMPPMMMGGRGGGGGGGESSRLSGMPQPSGPPVQQTPGPSAGVPITESKLAQGPVAAASEGLGDNALGEDAAGMGALAPSGSMGSGAPGGEQGSGAIGGGPGAEPGFTADPAVLRELGSSWEDAAQSIPTQPTSLPGLAEEKGAVLGLVAAAERPQQALSERIKVWLGGAVHELDAMVGRLHEAASQYEAAEEAGVAEAQKGTAQ